MKPDSSLVQEAATGQYPVGYPPTVEVVENARAGKDAASQVPIALGLGGAGLFIGLIALGLSLASRRKGAETP